MATSTLGSGTLVLAGTTSGTTTVTATAVAGTTTLTLPAATDTLVGKATTDTLTNKTLTSPTLTGVATFAAGSDAAPAITTTGDTNTGIFFPAADTIAFAEGGAEAMRLDSSGNLGLGVTPSAWSWRALQVGSFGGFFATNSAAYASYLGNNAYYDGSNWRYIASTGAVHYELAGGDRAHKWYNAASGTAGNAITFTQAMTLDASGNLGIGATTPSTYGKLVVSGGGFTQLVTTALPATSGSTRSDFTRILDSAGSRSLDSSISSTGAWIQSRDKNDYSVNYDLFLQPNGGNLLVGTTSATTNAGIGFKVLARSTDPTASVVGSETTNSSSCWSLYSTGAGAFRFYVGYGGTIFATSIVITAISDQRLKENVRDIDTGLDSIMALKPRRFDWKEGKGQDKKNVAGFIAQEFEDVFPECVGTSKAGEDGIEYKNINHETLIPTLVKAIQEQQSLITTLTTRITALESA